MEWTSDELVEIERMADYYAAVTTKQLAGILGGLEKCPSPASFKLGKLVSEWELESYGMFRTIAVKAAKMRKEGK